MSYYQSRKATLFSGRTVFVRAPEGTYVASWCKSYLQFDLVLKVNSTEYLARKTYWFYEREDLRNIFVQGEGWDIQALLCVISSVNEK